MPKPIAQIADAAMHGPPTLGPGQPTILIMGRPVWRVGDTHTCPMVNAPPPAGPGTPHLTGVTMPPGAIKTLMAGMPVACLSDRIMEAGAIVPLPPVNTILIGAPTVLG